MPKGDKNDWQPLRELALKTPYTMEYLSLMARQKQLKTKKVGRLWYSTLDSIREFEKERQTRKESKREKMREKYFRQAEKQPTKIRVTQAAIFDQIQGELEEVLEEIREKERRLREEYREGISRVPFRVAAAIDPKTTTGGPKATAGGGEEKAEGGFLRQEKRETEDLSEKLIMDLGKLLNTANQIQEDVETSRGREEQENHTPFLSLNYPDRRQIQNRSQVEIHNYAPPAPPVKKSGRFKKFLIAVISLLIFAAALAVVYLAYR